VETTVPDEFCIKTNSSFFLKTLRELVFNAVKYSDGEHIIVRVEQTDTAVRFVVEDTGSGIPEEDHDRMFEPFTKLNDLSEGLGLGLPLCKQHVDNLGGKLTLDADYHDGCRFIVELPKDNA
jgi:signal transduction histidine kinase